MAVYFQSLRSSSSGNCLMLWTQSTRILLDCGIKTQSGCRDLLAEHARGLDAVVVSHAHGDHICHSSLRVLHRQSTPVLCHEAIARQVRDKHMAGWDSPPPLHPFSTAPFAIGDLELSPIELPHAPGYANFGFAIRCGQGASRRKVVVCTDFRAYEAILDQLPQADFVFIEANHDLELLRLHPNPASHFHLSNNKTAQLLCRASRGGAFSPQTVMLGHLSKQRNSESLALETIHSHARQEGVDLAFRLEVAPRYHASPIITID